MTLFMSKRCTNTTHCQDIIMYGILNICFKINRYLESRYSYDDVLAVNNNSNLLLPISKETLPMISILANNIKRNLEEHILLPSITYKESLDVILDNLRATAVNIDHYRLDPGFYQLEDYTMVTDTQLSDYRTDDVGDQNDPRIAPISPEFIELEIRHPFCTPGIYNMSAMKFYE